MLLVILGQILQKQILTQKIHLSVWLPSLPSYPLYPPSVFHLPTVIFSEDFATWLTVLLSVMLPSNLLVIPLPISVDSTLELATTQTFLKFWTYIFLHFAGTVLITFHFLHPFTTSVSAILN